MLCWCRSSRGLSPAPYLSLVKQITPTACEAEGDTRLRYELVGSPETCPISRVLVCGSIFLIRAREMTCIIKASRCPPLHLCSSPPLYFPSTSHLRFTFRFARRRCELVVRERLPPRSCRLRGWKGCRNRLQALQPACRPICTMRRCSVVLCRFLHQLRVVEPWLSLLSK